MKKNVVVLLLSMSLFICMFNVYAEKETSKEIIQQSTNNNDLISSDYKLVAENTLLGLYFKQDTTEIALIDKKNNQTWYSNPVNRDNDIIVKGRYMSHLNSQIILTTKSPEKDTMDEKSNSTQANSINLVKTKNIKNGIMVRYLFGEDKIDITVIYEIKDNYLSVRVPINEIKENGDTKIYKVALLPFMGSGSKIDKGYILVPDGSGAVMNFNNGRQMLGEYESEVYGKDGGINQLADTDFGYSAKLPVYGINNNGKSLVSIIDSGDAHATIHATLSGKYTENNNVYSTFNVRYNDIFMFGGDATGTRTKNVDIYQQSMSTLKNISLRIYPVDSNDTVKETAEHYRKYLQQEKNFNKKEFMYNKAELSMIGAVRLKKSILGIPCWVNEKVTDTDDIQTISKELNNITSGGILYQWFNYTADELGEKIQDSAKPLSKLEKGTNLSNLSNILLKQNDAIGVSFNPIYYKNGGIKYNTFFNASQTISKSPALQNEFKLSTGLVDKTVKPGYLLSIEKVNKVVDAYIRSLEKQKVKIINIDYLTSHLYTDFRRQDAGRHIAQQEFELILNKLKENGYTLVGENSNGYTFPYLDYISNTPLTSTPLEIFDYSVPLYQMVISGMISYSGEPINLSDNIDSTVAKSMAFGCSPRFIIGMDNTSIFKKTNLNYLYGVNFSDLKKQIHNTIRERQEVDKLIRGANLINYVQISESLFCSKYSNGSVVYLNTANTDIKYNKKIIKANGYLAEVGVS